MDFDDRNEVLVTSPAPTTFTNLFAKSAQVTRSVLESDNDVFCPSNMTMKAKARAEIEDRQKELQRNADLYFEREKITEKFKEQTSLAEATRIENDRR